MHGGFLTGRLKNFNGNHYLDGFLAEESRSELQLQRRIGEEQFESWLDDFQEVKQDSKGVPKRSRDGSERTKGSGQIGRGFQFCHLEG